MESCYVCGQDVDQFTGIECEACGGHFCSGSCERRHPCGENAESYPDDPVEDYWMNCSVCGKETMARRCNQDSDTYVCLDCRKEASGDFRDEYDDPKYDDPDLTAISASRKRITPDD